MKSKLWIFATLLIVASMALAACQPETVVETVVVTEKETVVETVEVEKEVEVVQTVEVTAVPEPVGPVKITIFVGFGTGTSPEQQAVHAQLQELFNSTHDPEEIQIEFLTVPWAERITKYSTMLAADQPPDMVMPIGVGGIAEFYKGWLDLTPYIEADNYDMSRFAGATVEIHNYPGQGTLGLPLCVYPTGIYYNVDIFDAAGADYPPSKYGEPYADGEPWTYDKLVEVAKKITLDASGNDANSPAFDPENIVQFGWNGWDWNSPIDFSRHFGDLPGGGVSEDNTKSLLLEQQYVDAITFHKDTIWTWHIRANGEQAGAFYQNAGDPMGSGMVGMWEVNTWMSFAWPAWTEKFTWNVGAIPAGPNGKTLVTVDADTAVIPASAKYPDQSWEVMKWMFEPDNYKTLINNYGCLPADTEILATWTSDRSEEYPGVNFQVFVDALDYIEPSPNHEAWHPNYTKVNDVMTKQIMDVIAAGTNTDVPAILKAADAEVQKLLDEYWAANP
jgi:multiple sugar transport system substrate-binding protein